MSEKDPIYIKIKLETFLKILKFLNDYVRMDVHRMEYFSLSRLVMELKEENAFINVKKLSQFYYIRQIIKGFAKLSK